MVVPSILIDAPGMGLQFSSVIIPDIFPVEPPKAEAAITIAVAAPIMHRIHDFILISFFAALIHAGARLSPASRPRFTDGFVTAIYYG
ncbi:MAG TPA: hypothetical protein DEO84_03490 [candidate division Zixibacteria bacterium]|nr:hypothetical protein [candidate division Zixibacteria bacterium]